MALDSYFVKEGSAPDPSRSKLWSLPDLHLPGNYKFVSYKNCLQEYCQKKCLPNPVYTASPAISGGFLASVYVDTHSVESSGAMPSLKEAHQLAAFDALKFIGYLNKDLAWTGAAPAETGQGITKPFPPENIGGVASSVKQVALSADMSCSTYPLRDGHPDKLVKTHMEGCGRSCSTFPSPKSVFSNGPSQQNSPAASLSSLPSYQLQSQTFSMTFSSSLHALPSEIAADKYYSNTSGYMQEKVSRQPQLAFSHKLPKRKAACLQDYKSELNEFAQKKSIDLPKYVSSGTEETGFLAQVKLGEKEYAHSLPANTKKEAEQAAAHVALFMLGLLPCNSLENHGHAKNARTKEHATDIAALPDSAQPKPGLSYKNSLQEYCQKRRVALPVYTTVVLQDGVTATVFVDGNSYTGEACDNKKQAELAAAFVALKAILSSARQ